MNKEFEFALLEAINVFEELERVQKKAGAVNKNLVKAIDELLLSEPPISKITKR